MKQKNNKVLKYHRRPRLSFVTIIFMVILIYLFVQVIGYLSKDKVRIYEVGAPITYSPNPEYTGIITRNEIDYYMDKAGYINYYICEGKKARIGSTVATIDETGELSNLLKSLYPDGVQIEEEDLSSIKSSLVSSSASFSSVKFDKFYEDKYYINSSVLGTLNLSALENMEDTEKISGFEKMTAPVSGFILYQKDSFDGLTPEKVTTDSFNKKNYTKELYNPGEKREAGSFAYKCITDESFSITFPINEQDESIYGENNYLKIHLDSLDTIVNGKFSLITSSDGQRMGVIDLSKYGSSYVNKRYIDFSIVEKDITGLKVPVSAVFEKEFFTIPKDFLTTGGDKASNGVNKQTAYSDGTSVNFTSVTVMSSTDDLYYVDSNDIQAGDIIVKSDTGEQYTIGDMATVTGVYNINQGYTIFRRADVLETTDDKNYYIIDAGAPNGLNAYDHIILDASLVSEDQLIY